MSSTATGGRDLGGAAPPPPPEPVKESQGDDYASHAVFAKSLYDIVLIHQPVERGALRREAAGAIPAQSWREYVRYHSSESTNHPSQAQLMRAQDFFYDHALNQALERGWLVDKNGVIRAGAVPPDHRPLVTTGSSADAIAYRLARGDNEKAFAILQRGLRVKPDAALKRKLAKSLKETGQIVPVIYWHPSLRSRDEPIIIDGATRAELLEKEGEDATILVHEIPQDTQPIRVLAMRIETEMMKDTKTDEERAKFVALLQSEGMTQEDIGKIINRSQNRVSEILSTVSTTDIVDTPTPDDVAEFQWLSDGGWSIRAIAERTGFKKDTVHNYLTGKRTPKAAKAATPPKAAKPRTKAAPPPPKAKAAKAAPKSNPRRNFDYDEKVRIGGLRRAGMTYEEISEVMTGKKSTRNGGVSGIAEAAQWDEGRVEGEQKGFQLGYAQALADLASKLPHCPSCKCAENNVVEFRLVQ